MTSTHQKLTGVALISLSALCITVAIASGKGLGFPVRADLDLNNTVNIECPFGTVDGNNYLTLVEEDNSPVLGLTSSADSVTIEFNYSTGKFKFPLDSGYIHFKNGTITSGGTEMTYDGTICSGNSGYVLAKHGDTAEYAKSTNYETYIPLIPYYSASQFNGWCSNCTSHKENITGAQANLYNLVIDKTNVLPENVPSGGEQEEAETYVLDGTKTGGTNGYATESDITQGDIDWKVTGNTTMNPWRIGGKNLSNVDRPVYSTKTLSDNIVRVDVDLGSATATLNSITVISATNNDFTAGVVTKTVSSPSLNTTTSFTDTWGSDRYFKIIFNVSAGGSNQYIQLKSISFIPKSN